MSRTGVSGSWMLGLALLAPSASDAQSAEEATEEIVAPAFEPQALMYGWGWWAGPCPASWPSRVLALLESSGVSPLSEQCQSVVADFNGDAAPDAAFTAATESGSAFVVVLDGPEPEASLVAPRGRFDALAAIPAGEHSLGGCFDIIVPTPAPDTLPDRVADYSDGRLQFAFPGFAISSDGKGMTYYHFRDGRLHEELGSGC